MSNREALRKFTRKFPTEPEAAHILELLENEPDLSVVITATAIVEGHLEKLLISRFKTISSRLNGHLFSNRGPLSDFQGKILVAHAFRIIDDNFAEELHSLRAIRNTFAHSKIPVSFDTELIKRELQTIVSANLLRQKALETPIIKTWKNKHHFLFAIKVFLTFIGEAMERGGDFEEVRQAFRDEAKRLASK